MAAQQTTEALLDVFKAVSASDSTDVNRTFFVIVGAICKALEADRVSLWFVHKANKQLVCRHSLQLKDVTETVTHPDEPPGHHTLVPSSHSESELRQRRGNSIDTASSRRSPSGGHDHSQTHEGSSSRRRSLTSGSENDLTLDRLVSFCSENIYSKNGCVCLEYCLLILVVLGSSHQAQ